MKLAEALQERADLDRRVKQLRERLSSNAVVQEGEQPAEDPGELLSELDRSISELEQLVAKINLTNCRTMVDGETLTACLSRRDALKLKLSAYRDLAYDASQLGRRATRSEIKLYSAVNVKDLQKQIDSMARELRRLDNRIQETNWSASLD